MFRVAAIAIACGSLLVGATLFATAGNHGQQSSPRTVIADGFGWSGPVN